MEEARVLGRSVGFGAGVVMAAGARGDDVVERAEVGLYELPSRIK